MLISNEKLVEYFEYNNLTVTCPVCQNVGWEVSAAHKMGTLEKENDTVVSHIPFARLNEETNQTSSFMGGYPVVFLVCKSCGYMRMHSYKLLHNKITEMEAKKEKAQDD